jgi:Glyoxalase-like domain
LTLALYLRQIALVARERDPVVADLEAVLGLEVCYEDPGVAHFGLHNALLAVGSQFLEVVAPIEENTAGGRYLDRRGGDSGYMVITQTDDHPRRKARVQELGIRIVSDFSGHGFTNMQLHPADTGGSFFEIDAQEGDDPSGDWEPAGPDWRPHVRTEVVSAIAAAEIQVDEPVRVAARWSEIAEIDVTDEEGTPTIRLDNAALRFVGVSDGRGEGLGGIDLLAADADRAMTAAEERGVRSADAQALIGGVRINLVE